ncbi:VOC family protein [Parasphingorhabdus pacifica]
MSVQLNHTVVHSRDKQAGAKFLTEVLGLPEAEDASPFLAVQVANNVTLDYLDTDRIVPQHYAFEISEPEFDEVLARVRQRGMTYWADPYHQRPGEINDLNGGRGFYFDDPDGHNLEVLTKP